MKNEKVGCKIVFSPKKEKALKRESAEGSKTDLDPRQGLRGVYLLLL
jgi:hypothetical protein